MSTIRKCAYKHCNTKRDNSTLSFFRFPVKDYERCKVWAENCGNLSLLNLSLQSLQHRAVCEKHFLRSDFKDYSAKRRLLNFKAAPIKFGTEGQIQDQYSNILVKIDTEMQPRPTHPKTYSKKQSVEVDPLLLTDTDMSLFGNTFGNIEFVVEDSEDEAHSDNDTMDVQIIQSEDGGDSPITEIEGEAVDNETLVMDQTSTSSRTLIKEEIVEAEEPQILEVSTGTYLKDVNDIRSSLREAKNEPSAESEINDADLVDNPGCYVPNCKIKIEERDDIFWFHAPMDENLRKIWDICIDRRDKRLGSIDVVCHKHFSRDDLVYTNAVIKGNETASLPKEQAQLKKGAVPCINFYEECCVPMCGRKTGRMYCFPIARKSEFRLWCYMIRNPILKNLKIKELLRHRVCEVHFEKDCFEKDMALTRAAAPTLCIPAFQQSFSINTKATSYQEIANMANPYNILRCIHGECKNRPSIEKNVFLFPTDPNRCVAWLKACGRQNMITTPMNSVHTVRIRSLGVCEDHFDFNCFETTLDTLTADAVPRQYKPSKKRSESRAIDLEDEDMPLVEPESSSSVNVSTSEKGPNKDRREIPTNVCIYRHCLNNPAEDIQLFSFPEDEARCTAWLQASGHLSVKKGHRGMILKDGRLCSRHFRPEMFEADGKLKDKAVPVHYSAGPNITSGSSTETPGTAAKNSVAPFRPACRMYCAVETCGNYYSSSGTRRAYHLFPDPDCDEERYNMWISLIGNKSLSGKTAHEIRKRYMVCFKHFDSKFYDVINKTILNNAVPTLMLPENIDWFYESDYFLNRIQNVGQKIDVQKDDTTQQQKDANAKTVKGFSDVQKDDTTQQQKDANAKTVKGSSELPATILIEDEKKKKDYTRPGKEAEYIWMEDKIEWKKCDASEDKADTRDKTKCVLQEDRITFPGLGHYIHFGDSSRLVEDGNRKCPYSVYRHFKGGYGLHENVEFGDTIKIHTAIIIDDDDDCERAVLQQLLDKRIKK